jgi:hypothetical protein
VVDQLYYPDMRDRVLFGDAYVPPARFHHGQWYLVARFEKDEPHSDGQPVRIDEMRLPARAFRLRALASRNSVGEVLPAWSLSTGTGDDMGRLCVEIAKAASEGMIAVDTPLDATMDDIQCIATATMRALSEEGYALPWASPINDALLNSIRRHVAEVTRG